MEKVAMVNDSLRRMNEEIARMKRAVEPLNERVGAIIDEIKKALPMIWRYISDNHRQYIAIGRSEKFIDFAAEGIEMVEASLLYIRHTSPDIDVSSISTELERQKEILKAKGRPAKIVFKK
jgi:hypothetical protein